MHKVQAQQLTSFSCVIFPPFIYRRSELIVLKTQFDYFVSEIVLRIFICNLPMRFEFLVVRRIA